MFLKHEMKSSHRSHGQQLGHFEATFRGARGPELFVWERRRSSGLRLYSWITAVLNFFIMQKKSDSSLVLKETPDKRCRNLEHTAGNQ